MDNKIQYLGRSGMRFTKKLFNGFVFWLVFPVSVLYMIVMIFALASGPATELMPLAESAGLFPNVFVDRMEITFGIGLFIGCLFAIWYTVRSAYERFGLASVRQWVMRKFPATGEGDAADWQEWSLEHDDLRSFVDNLTEYLLVIIAVIAITSTGVALHVANDHNIKSVSPASPVVSIQKRVIRGRVLMRIPVVDKKAMSQDRHVFPPVPALMHSPYRRIWGYAQIHQTGPNTYVVKMDTKIE